MSATKFHTHKNNRQNYSVEIILQNIKKVIGKLFEGEVQGNEVDKAVSAKIVGCHIVSRVEPWSLLLKNVHLQ
jgi:hypothetical protein